MKACLTQIAQPARLQSPAAIFHTGLWPAVDPIFSRSSLLRADAVGEAHVNLANRARRLLRRYMDLPDADDPQAFEALNVEDQRTSGKPCRVSRLVTAINDIDPYFC